MVNHAKEHEEFRRLYGPILCDTVKRQMQIHQLKMHTLDFRNGYVLDGGGDPPIEIPADLERDKLEVPVNDKRDLFIQTTRKRKTGSNRFDHSEIFTNDSTRERAKTLMNLAAR